MARHRQRTGGDGTWPDTLVNWSVWSPMLVGVFIMLGYTLYAIVLQADSRPLPGNSAPFAVPTPPPEVATPAPLPVADDPSAVPVHNPRAAEPVPSPSASPAPGESETPSAPDEPSAPTEREAPPAPDVSGTYRLDDSYGDAFIGKVVIVNESRQRQDWTVTLAFPDNVGELNTFWVDGTPQPTSRRSGDTYTFTSTVPVAASDRVVLKFHFSRTGRDVDPTVCRVNGAPCTL